MSAQAGKPWTIEDSIPAGEFIECWDGCVVVHGLSRNQARARFAWDYGYPYVDVLAHRVWLGPWSAAGDVPCEDCDCGAEDVPGAECQAFGVVSRRTPNYTPGWKVSVA